LLIFSSQSNNKKEREYITIGQFRLVLSYLDYLLFTKKGIQQNPFFGFIRHYGLTCNSATDERSTYRKKIKEKPYVKDRFSSDIKRAAP
jgi:hypothetical protein